MTTDRKSVQGEMVRNLPRAHEWEMISAFVLRLPEKKVHPEECLLEPIGAALEPYGLEDDLLCEISKAVEETGEELRSNCPEGKMNCVTVRVHMSTQALRSSASSRRPWSFFMVKQIASSESDNLEALENPNCTIDLHVFQEA